MRIGDLVEIGWNGKKKKPFIGVIVSLGHSKLGKTGSVMVNGQVQYVDLEKLRKVTDATRGFSQSEIIPEDWADSIKE